MSYAVTGAGRYLAWNRCWPTGLRPKSIPFHKFTASAQLGVEPGYGEQRRLEVGADFADFSGKITTTDCAVGSGHRRQRPAFSMLGNHGGLQPLPLELSAVMIKVICAAVPSRLLAGDLSRGAGYHAHLAQQS
jgi:hypothetical protein